MSKLNWSTEDARATIEYAVRDAITRTSMYHRLTADKCDEMVPAIVDSIFKSSTVWAVEVYLNKDGERKEVK